MRKTEALSLAVAALLALSLPSCATQPSPYVEVFGNTVAEMTDDYRDVVERTAMIEQHAAILRTSSLNTPQPSDYEIRDTIRPFLDARVQLLDVVTSYARLLSAVVTKRKSEVIVRSVELVTSAKQLDERHAAIGAGFVAAAEFVVDHLQGLESGTAIEAVMAQTQPAIDDITAALEEGQQDLARGLVALTERFRGDVLRIRSRGEDRLSWTERERLDQLTFEVVTVAAELRADLARLDDAVGALPGLHRLVAENVFNLIEAKNVVARLSPFGRRTEKAVENLAVPSSFPRDMQKQMRR